MVQTRKADDGYKFIEKLGFSYQGVSAEDALKIVERISKFLSLQWRIEFEWRDKPDAFLPGGARDARYGFSSDDRRLDERWEVIMKKTQAELASIGLFAPMVVAQRMSRMMLPEFLRTAKRPRRGQAHGGREDARRRRTAWWPPMSSLGSR